MFPVNLSKRPITPNGFRDATLDPRTIRRWWSLHPSASIASPLQAGLLVLDVDIERQLAELEAKHEPLPPTVEVVTPRPGRHLYFRGAATNSSGGLPDGIHVRGVGGYVVLPPSPHENGGRYEWRTAPDELPIAPAPPWLLELLASVNGSTPAAEGEIPNGRRNIVLTSMAGSMRRGGFGEAAMAAALLIENRERCKPPLAEPEVRRIAHSIARYPVDPTFADFLALWRSM